MSGPWKPHKNLNKQVVTEESFSTSINPGRPSDTQKLGFREQSLTIKSGQIQTETPTSCLHQNLKSPSILNYVLPTDPLRRTIYLPSILWHWPGNRRPGDPTYGPVLLRFRVTLFVPLAHLEICLPPKQPHPQKLKKQFSCKLTRLSPPLCNDCLHGTFFFQDYYQNVSSLAVGPSPTAI